VQSALQGECQHIKERTIGIEVFGRNTDYDVTQDHVVRAAAAEVRKRLAQYYYGPEHAGEIRIDLRPGTYLPEFHLPEEKLAPAAEPSSVSPEMPAVAPKSLRRQRRRWLAVLCVAFFIVAVIWIGSRTRLKGLTIHHASNENTLSSVDLFWKPFLDPPGRLLLCVGIPPEIGSHLDGGSIPLANAFALVRLAEFLGLRGKGLQPRTANSLTFQDLIADPAVIVGGFDNPWAINELKPLRFHFQQQPGAHLIWIEDSANPSSREWSVNTTLPASQITEEYAIVVRNVNTNSSHPHLTIAGLTTNGVAAAIDCLQKTMCDDDIAKHAPKGWPFKDIEAVIVVEMINGQPGPSRVLAVEGLETGVTAAVKTH